MPAPAHRARGFTLVELLVVISIIALLMGLLLPALGKARRAAQFAANGSNQRQIGIGIAAYAVEYNGLLPRGPETEQTLFVGAFLPPGGWGGRNWSQIASNQIYISSAWPGDGGGQVHTTGLLIEDYLLTARILYSPGDDSLDPVEELEKFDNRAALDQDAYSSYFHRQRDQTSRDLIEDMGLNGAGLAATALLMDANNTDTSNPAFFRTNFGAEQVNVLYLDGHVEGFRNENDTFSLTAADNAGFPISNLEKLDRMFVAADYGLIGDPIDAPTLTYD